MPSTLLNGVCKCFEHVESTMLRASARSFLSIRNKWFRRNLIGQNVRMWISHPPYPPLIIELATPQSCVAWVMWRNYNPKNYRDGHDENVIINMSFPNSYFMFGFQANRVTLKMDVSHTDHSHIIGRRGQSINRGKNYFTVLLIGRVFSALIELSKDLAM